MSFQNAVKSNLGAVLAWLQSVPEHELNTVKLLNFWYGVMPPCLTIVMSTVASLVPKNNWLHCISAVTIGEIQAGIEITRGQDKNKAHKIEQWLNLVAQSYSVLDMDALAFRTLCKTHAQNLRHLV